MGIRPSTEDRDLLLCLIPLATLDLSFDLATIPPRLGQSCLLEGGQVRQRSKSQADRSVEIVTAQDYPACENRSADGAYPLQSDDAAN